MMAHTTTGKNATAVHEAIAVRGLHGKASFDVRAQ
jgi:hypothetical protein